jgi:hypothetical protein
MNWNRLALLLLAMSASSGCHRDVPDPSRTSAHHHEHHPPHQGTPVVLGDEEYHIEFVLHPASGQLQAFVMDGELENFVRIRMEAFDAAVKRTDGREDVLRFRALASRATGETIGDTSAFEAQAEWLRTNATFNGSIKQIVVRDRPYLNVQFNFPKGNEVHDKD